MTGSRGEMRQVYPPSRGGFQTRPYRLDEQDGRFTFEPGGEASEGQQSAVTLAIESRKAGEGLCRDESGRTYLFAWAWVGAELHLWLDGALYVFQRGDPSASSGRRRRGGGAAAEASGDIVAPMPGAVLEVLVSEGDRVERNQTVMVMESMKMELLISAPRDGVVRRVSAQPGQQVERGMRLLELAPEDGAGG